MKQIKRKQLIFQNSSNYLNILFHNIEGLKCNFNALQNHHLTQHADLILNGYQLIHKSRSFSFPNNHTLHCQKRGGVALSYRDDISLQEIHSCEHLNLEHITFELLKEKLIVKNIFLIGDFNENSLSDKSKPIETKLKSLGFINLYKNVSTTNSLISLDCLYCNFTLIQDHHKDIGAAYYSFHDTLMFSINNECQINNSNREIEYNYVESMEVDDTVPSPLPIVDIPKKSIQR
ncbi:unnamed protein product [Rotaria magnacalcarata]|uniref:Uncharacterized protein n=1 Tax=Rotaria magnacalcarata TaxID=392030 RepID=A0A8S2QI89_9BILA|nr:unnamed protein product [Rotaria magnacalcarata]